MSYTYPGVYIQKLQSPVHTITGVATSITAFAGYAPRGIDALAQTIFSFSDFQRLYGGLATDSAVSYAVAQFYQNAPGSQATSCGCGSRHRQRRDGGTPTNTAEEDLGLRLSVSQPSSFTGLPVTVTVFKAGDRLPQSLSGVASAVQRAPRPAARPCGST